MQLPEDIPVLMLAAEVARLFRVDAKTVSRWALEGRLASVKTPGGHHRFRTIDMIEMVTANGFSTLAEALQGVRESLDANQ